MSNIRNNLSRYSIYLCVFIVAVYIFSGKYWNQKDKVIGADVISYYAYLPATFIFHDVKLENDYTMKNGIFWPETLPDGARVIKTSMGMSVLYSPFFFASHAIAKLTGADAFGYSNIYKIGLLVGAIFYLFIGLFFLRKILKIYFSESITALTIVAITLGTNLLHYATREATMSHLYNFTLLNIFIWLTIQWYKNPKLLKLILIGLLAGFITLVRPSNIIILAFFFLYDVYSIKTFGHRFTAVFKKFHWYILMGLAFTLVWIPQMLYWKELSGQLLFNSYTTERFFFNQPHFIDGLFSYRKGWLLYTPMMILSMAGIVLMFKKLKRFSLAISVFTFLNMYIVFSWWCWWYGGSFGMRALIDSYGMLAIPMALLFTEALKYRKYLYKIVVGLAIILIVQNVSFVRKYRSGSIHWDSMTKEAFWNAFWRFSPLPEYWDLLEQPDYEKAKLGIDAVIQKDKE